MLEFKNIQMAFDGNCILKNINGLFDQSQLIAITGQNGVGKSTLIRILAGLQRPSQGAIYFFNKDLYTLSEKRLAKLRTYIPSEPLCHWNLRVKDIIGLGLLNTKLSENKKMEKIYKIMKDLDLLEFKSREINSMSSGEKAMVYLARAAVANPDYIFADELLSNLHIDNQHKIMRYLKHLTTLGQTIILVTHNVDIATQYCDKIFNMDDEKERDQKENYSSISCGYSKVN